MIAGLFETIHIAVGEILQLQQKRPQPVGVTASAALSMSANLTRSIAWCGSVRQLFARNYWQLYDALDYEGQESKLCISSNNVHMHIFVMMCIHIALIIVYTHIHIHILQILCSSNMPIFKDIILLTGNWLFMLFMAYCPVILMFVHVVFCDLHI